MPIHTHVVSSTPGRTRFKVPPHRRTHQQMEQLAASIEAHPDVQGVQFNTQTGSLLVHHDPNQAILHEVKDALRDLGCVFADVTGTSELVSFKDESGKNLDFDSAIEHLNSQVLELTNGIVNLQYVLPLGLGLLAVLQFLTFGWQFDIVPWYVLFYFAVDSFIKLNLQEEPETVTS